MIIGVLTFIFILVCVLMVVAILLQSSSTEGLGGIAGMSSTNPIFGRGSASFLQKLTTGLAIAYMLLGLILARFWVSSPTPRIELKPESSQTESVEDSQIQESGVQIQESEGETQDQPQADVDSEDSTE
jgi:preprotein translocase subunit SecG